MTVATLLSHYEIALMAVGDGVQVAGFTRSFLRHRKLLAGHLFVNFLNVGGHGTFGVPGDARVSFERGLDLLGGIANLLWALLGLDQLADLFAQGAEIFLLI